MATSILQAPARPEIWTGAVIDTDVHAVVPSLAALYPYLADVWKQFFEERNWRGPSVGRIYPPGLQATARPQWRPADGTPPASSVPLLKEHILDTWSPQYAILNCVYPVDAGPPDVAIALARAVNDWLIAEWLEVDDRLRASIVVPTKNPAEMAAEIDRVGDHPGFVQALLPVRSGQLYGRRLWDPVFAAIERRDLVAGIHFGGLNDGHPPTPVGWPSWYVEEYVAEVQVFEAQLLSLVAEGVFQRFPSLRVAMLEAGFTWVPTWVWDMDRGWKTSRREIPWVKELPSTIIHDHVRFSTAPLDVDSPEELEVVAKWLDPELLMFATDYPHMHDDDVTVLLEGVPQASRAGVMADNARQWYRLA